MALVATVRNTVDMLIADYKGKAKYILLDIDNYLKFKAELVALNLYEPTSPEVIIEGEKFDYRNLKVLVVFDTRICEVVG
jgi:hypothetical protein